MKQVLLLTLATFSIAGLGVAGPCADGTLAAYVTLGAGGCTIDGNTLSNFQILSGISFATPIPPTAITITPAVSGFNPGLTISTSQIASAGSLLEIIFTYEISGLMYIDSSVMLSGSSETVDGAVTGIENYCAGGAFGPDGVSGCTGANGSLLTLDGIQQSDMGAFGNASFINVTNDLTFDSGLAGTASGGTFADSFTAVPEPVSAALAGLGLALAAVCRWRPRRIKKQINEEENQ